MVQGLWSRLGFEQGLQWSGVTPRWDITGDSPVTQSVRHPDSRLPEEGTESGCGQGSDKSASHASAS